MTATALDLILPSAELLGVWPVGSPEWIAARRSGITGSDAPAVAGVDEYRTRAHIYYDKLGELNDDAGEPALWGNLLEDPIAVEWARRTGCAIATIGTVRHRAHPTRLVNLDRLVTAGCDSDRIVCGVEAKNRNAYVAGKWRRDIPDDVAAQVQWQLHVTGLDHMHVAVLIGGNNLVQHVVEPDAEIIGYLAAEADKLWEHVQARVVPYVDPSDLLLDLLDRLHPNRAGAAVVDHTAAAVLHGEYKAAKADEKAAKTRAEAAKAGFVALLGPGDHAITAEKEPRVLATYRPDQRTHVDLERLALYPDAYAAAVQTRPTKPILRFKSKELS